MAEIVNQFDETKFPRFEHRFAVEAKDIDRMGHVNNIVYVRWIQDMAVKHWRVRATDEQQAKVLWVVVRHEIDYLRAAVEGDEIVARTWVGSATRTTYERLTEIERAADKKLLVKARSVWCAVDAATKRPIRADAALRARFEQIDKSAEVRGDCF